MYIGQTCDFKRRMKHHCNVKNDTLIHRAIVKYGKENFEFKVLYTREESFIDEAERTAIKYYNSLSPNGYNLESGGSLHKKHSQETKDKIRLASIGHKQEPLTPEQYKRLCDSHKGLKGNRLGQKATQETIQKLRDSHRGLKQSKESIEKRAKSNIGKKRTPEQRANISNGQLGKKMPAMSDEQKLKISMANKGKKKPPRTKEHTENFKKHFRLKYLVRLVLEVL